MTKWTEREMWAALLPFILGILTTTGVIGPENGSQVGGIILMVGPAMAYIVMRVIQKIKETDAAATVKVAQAESKATVAVAEAQAPPAV
jgi:uncharacterized membrane protein